MDLPLNSAGVVPICRVQSATHPRLTQRGLCETASAPRGRHVVERQCRDVVSNPIDAIVGSGHVHVLRDEDLDASVVIVGHLGV